MAMFGGMANARPPATTVYLDAELRRRLDALARRSGAPRAEIIRRALGEFLARADRVAAVLADPAALGRLTPVQRLVLSFQLGGTVPADLERTLTGAP